MAKAKKTVVKKTPTAKRFLRSRKDRMIGGVLGGLSEYFSVDSTILRLAFIALVAFTGFVPGIVAYGVAMIVIPDA